MSPRHAEVLLGELKGGLSFEARVLHEIHPSWPLVHPQIPKFRFEALFNNVLI